MVVKVVPPLVETCHCTVGAGTPVPAAVKLAGWPWATWVLTGEAVTVGRVLNSNVAGVESTEPAGLVNTAWYSFPFSPAAVVNV